jgi:hypothetical protein
MDIANYNNDIICAVGGRTSINIPRRVSQYTFDLLKLGEYDSTAFVMESIPFNCDVIFRN